MITAVPARYRSLPAVEAVQHALRDAVTVEEARRRVAHFDLATGRPRPAWYREERPDDAHGATLVSGAVLAWGRFSPAEPWELFFWVDAERGTVLWRERL